MRNYSKLTLAMFLSLTASVAAARDIGGDLPLTEFKSDEKGAVNFGLPSGNIECIFSNGDGAEIACDREKPAYVHVWLGATGKGRMVRNPGEQPCCGSVLPLLPHGSQWRAGPFVCVSAIQGLTCERADGHGFFVSRASLKAY